MVTNKYYSFFQPGKRKRGADCVVRAFCKALDFDWLSSYDLLVKTGREVQAMPNDSYTIDFLLRKILKWEPISVQPKKGETRKTILEWAKTHPTGTYILKVATHIVCCKDGKYYDSWDSGSCCLYKVWYKNK